VARHGNNQPNCLLNQRGGKVLIKDRSLCDQKFLFYALSEPKTVASIALKGHGAANQANVSPSLVESVEIPLPHIAAQNRIAGILSAYDELIENSQRRIRLLEEMARSLYREWFVHFRFPGHEDVSLVDSSLGPIPDGWGVRTIQHFGQVVTGKTPSKANPAFYGEDLPFVKTPDMHGNLFVFGTNERLSFAGANSQANKTIPSGSICVSCIGTIGVVSITTEKCQTNQQINSLVLRMSPVGNFSFFGWKTPGRL
jgi:type I restriction enzyme, S subunit